MTDVTDVTRVADLTDVTDQPSDAPSTPVAVIDPRVARTRRVVMDAAIEELVDVGFNQVSIDAIAERSGVARSTIYRNWGDRTSLLAEAFLAACGQVEPIVDDRSSSLEQDLEAMAGHLIGKLRSDGWNRTVPSLIGAAVADDGLRVVMADFSAERRQEAIAVVHRAVDRGELVERDADGRALDEVLNLVLERFVAPFFFRRLMSQAPIDDDRFVESQIAAALAELAPFRTGGAQG